MKLSFSFEVILRGLVPRLLKFVKWTPELSRSCFCSRIRVLMFILNGGGGISYFTSLVTSVLNSFVFHFQINNS